MKILLATVTALAVLISTCQVFGSETVDQKRTTEIPNVSMGQGSTQIEEMEDETQRQLRRSGCKPRNACIILSGFCVTNATLCSGRLVPEGCKGANCQCCIPGTFETEFGNLEEELKSFMENMELSDSNLNSDLQSIKDDTNNINQNVNSLENKVNDMDSNINSKLDTIAENQDGCRESKGFFRVSESGEQCFKFFPDSGMPWDAAKNLCEENGLVLAKPSDEATAVALRELVVEKYANGGEILSWLGARGTGSLVAWERDGTTLSSSSSAWYPGAYRTGTNNCLELMTRTSNINSHRTMPYYMASCPDTNKYPLCELIM